MNLAGVGEGSEQGRHSFMTKGKSWKVERHVLRKNVYILNSFIKSRTYFSIIYIDFFLFFAVTARGDDEDYVEVVIGVLTAITLLLLLIFIIILLISRRQKLQNSPSILKNPFEFAINMKASVFENSINFFFLLIKRN